MTKLRDCNADHSYPLAYRVCQALALLCRLPWALRFEDATEAIYQAEIVKETLRYWRFTLIFGCALVAFFTIWDANFFPQSQWRLLLLRMYIVIPILVAAASLTRLARGWNGQRMQSLLVAAVWHTGTGVTAMMAFATKPLAFYVFFPGVMLAFIYMAALIVGGGYVLFGGGVLLATYIALSLSIGMPTQVLGMSIFFMLATYSVAVFASYEMERYKRREFTARIETERLFLQITAEKQQVERANAEKSGFLAAASHDLRQPVQAIANFVAVLKAGHQEISSEYLIGRVEASLQSLDNLFLALLDISRLDASQVEPNLRAFPITSSLEVIKAEFEAVAAAKDLNLRVHMPALVVRSDVQLIERILRNLVGNALSYTQHGAILIGCRRRHDQVAVQVWDTGIGIADEHLALIFQEFYQVDNPERDRRLGLGLGLSIVKRLCALLGHTLHVRSVPGRGSMFEIMLPSAAATESVITSDAAPSEQRNILSGAVVLVIDDELEVRESCSLLLESWGCFAIAADSAHDAIARIQGGWRFPDLIIADFRLRANATGADAIRRVRDDCGLEIPGILITGDTAPERIREARASGFRLYHKPLAAAQLNAALMCALTGAACSDLS